ncbi:MAG: helix-turn-helix domain-containing protein, partial [Synergistaceae bacterium]|nr:helix-turn-helix domain-containing protein [Synergistaceae bacterium]
LKFFRKHQNITQSHLAELLGIHEMTVRRWESGEREPRASDIQKLCEVLGVTESELLNGLADDELKFTFVLDMKEVESMEVRMNEFKIGTGDNDIFGLFRIPKDTNVDEIGKQFMDHLRAELVGDKAKRDELKKLNG